MVHQCKIHSIDNNLCIIRILSMLKIVYYSHFKMSCCFKTICGHFYSCIALLLALFLLFAFALIKLILIIIKFLSIKYANEGWYFLAFN